MADPHIAVVDIGSTHIRFANATSKGPLDVHTEQTHPAELTTQLTRIVERLQRQSESLQCVSISTTGLVDVERGVIVEFDTATGETLHDIPLTRTLEAEFGLPTTLENDCTAAALGEDRFGVGQQYDTVVHVTFGTGIGAGVIIDGRPLRGERGYGAEVGLIPLVADGELTSTGVRGAWEAYCSGRGIPQFATHLFTTDERDSVLRDRPTLTAPAVFDAAADGDEIACKCLEQVARYNAAGIGAIANTYDPGVITLGGSVALKNPEWMLDGIHQSLDEYVLADPPALQLTSLGADIELYGATANCL